uniref:Major facilitator superfamily (MFS) profile domain-containing protein n=1 Tax=Caenorhabditis japonica TaxID=281687 RepID=A0A8R1IH08_CAEJA
MLVFVAFITREWHTASYLCAAISALIFPMLWKLPESPVFLEQKHKIEEAIESRKRIAEICDLEYEEKEVTTINNLKKITFFEMLKNERLRKNFLVLCFM